MRPYASRTWRASTACASSPSSATAWWSGSPAPAIRSAAWPRCSPCPTCCASSGSRCRRTRSSSRNVAAVIVTADLPGAVRAGDRFDVNVAAIGDARSLAGGTLLMTPLMANNKVAYAMAQGPLAVGGYKFEQRGTSAQKNFPDRRHDSRGRDRAALAGARARAAAPARSSCCSTSPTTPPRRAWSRRSTRTCRAAPPRRSTPAACACSLGSHDAAAAVAMMARIESLAVNPDVAARVVVNERTGTVVSGGDVYLSAVTVTHGDLRGVHRRATTTSRSPKASSSAASERHPHRGGARGDRARLRGRAPGREPATVARPSRDLVDALRAIKVTLARRHRHPAGHQARRRAACRTRHSVRSPPC